MTDHLGRYEMDQRWHNLIVHGEVVEDRRVDVVAKKLAEWAYYAKLIDRDDEGLYVAEFDWEKLNAGARVAYRSDAMELLWYIDEVDQDDPDQEVA